MSSNGTRLLKIGTSFLTCGTASKSKVAFNSPTSCDLNTSEQRLPKDLQFVSNQRIPLLTLPPSHLMQQHTFDSQLRVHEATYSNVFLFSVAILLRCVRD